MKSLFTSDEITNILTYKNTHSNVFFSNRSHEYKIINKMPILLPNDLSTLEESFCQLVTKLKEIQNIVDSEFTLDKIINECQDHQTMYEVAEPFHIIYSVIHRVNNKIGYTFNHAIYDSFSILSKLNIIGLHEPIAERSNLLDIIHIKKHTTIPYHIHNAVNYHESDGVECMILLSGDMKFYASTHPNINISEKYEEILPKNRIIAFNPKILHTGVALTEDVYLLYLRFSKMSFTELLKKKKINNR